MHGLLFQQEKIPAPQMSFTPDAVFPILFTLKRRLSVSACKRCLRGYHFIRWKCILTQSQTMLPSCFLSNWKPWIRKSLLSWETQTRCHFTVENAGASLRLTAEGFAAHAAHPSTGINAISGLMSALSELSPENELARIATFYMEHIGFDLTGKGLGIDLTDEISGRLSFNVGKVEVCDHKVIFSIDNRVPVTYWCAQVQELIQKQLIGSGFRLRTHMQLNPSTYLRILSWFRL